MESKKPKPRRAGQASEKPTQQRGLQKKKKKSGSMTWLYIAIPIGVLLLIGVPTVIFLIMNSRANRRLAAEQAARDALKPLQTTWVARQQNGASQDPPAATAGGFKVEDNPEPGAGSAVNLDVSLYENEDPKTGKPEPALPDKDQLPWVTFARDANNEFGITTTPHAPGGAANKRLTFAPDGATNTTIIGIDGVPLRLAGPQVVRERENVKRSADGLPLSSERVYAVGKVVEITERLSIVNGNPVDTPSGSKRYLDTVQVRYKFASLDKRPHRVALRQVVDTLIGGNDGVPFTISGRSGMLLANGFADFRAKEVPQFVQALETPDLRNPGTVAHITCRAGDGMDAPDRVILTHWPGIAPAWDVPIVPLRDDSAIVFYWFERPITAAQPCEVGFEYGLGSIASQDGSLGINLSGDFGVKQLFTVTAYVHNPSPKQKITLELPNGLERVDGAPTQPVVGVAGKQTTVTWRVRVNQTGDFKIKVVTSDGMEQTKQLSIGERVTLGGPIALEAVGPFVAGKPFTIKATVTNPAPGQMLTLTLPPELTTPTDKLPVPDNAGAAAFVNFPVTATNPGAYIVALKSSLGLSMVRRLAIRRQDGDASVVTLEIAPEPKGDFFVATAKVENATPGQKLTLRLPKGVKLKKGEEAVTLPEGEKSPTMKWTFAAEANGDYPIDLESSAGGGSRKILKIDRGSKIGGAFTLEFEGEFEPGKSCTLVADIPDPAPNQTLTITMPKGMQLMEGKTTQTVEPVAIPIPGNSSKVRWTVRPSQAGSYNVRVASSTGASRSRTLTLEAK